MSYVSPAGSRTVSKTFTLSGANLVYDQGKAVTPADLRVGDHIQFAINYADSVVLEGVDAYAAATMQSMFKTQYDTATSGNASKGSGINYRADHVELLDLPSQLTHS